MAAIFSVFPEGLRQYCKIVRWREYLSACDQYGLEKFLNRLLGMESDDTHFNFRICAQRKECLSILIGQPKEHCGFFIGDGHRALSPRALPQ